MLIKLKSLIEKEASKLVWDKHDEQVREPIIEKVEEDKDESDRLFGKNEWRWVHVFGEDKLEA